LLVGADGLFQQFADAKFQNSVGELSNRLKISAGAEYVNRPKSGKYIDRVLWRLGAKYSNSYAKINGHNIGEYAITAGVGLPFRPIKGILNLNFEFGRFGTAKHDLISEKYFRIGINFALNENWFFKPKIQ